MENPYRPSQRGHGEDTPASKKGGVFREGVTGFREVTERGGEAAVAWAYQEDVPPFGLKVL